MKDAVCPSLRAFPGRLHSIRVNQIAWGGGGRGKFSILLHFTRLYTDMMLIYMEWDSEPANNAHWCPPNFNLKLTLWSTWKVRVAYITGVRENGVLKQEVHVLSVETDFKCTETTQHPVVCSLVCRTLSTVLKSDCAPRRQQRGGDNWLFSFSAVLTPCERFSESTESSRHRWKQTKQQEMTLIG